MNNYQKTRINRRITAVEAIVLTIGLFVVVGNVTVHKLFPLGLFWVFGLGLAYVIGLLGRTDTAWKTSITMYLYGAMLPVFGTPTFGHDGVYIAIFSVLTVFGGLLFVSTADKDRFGSPASGVAGALLGGALSIAVLYAL